MNPQSFQCLLYQYSLADFFENKTRKIRQVNICEHSLYDCISYIFVFFLVLSKEFRSSHQRCSMKKGVLRNLTKFTCARVSFLISCKAQVCDFIKKEAVAQMFSCKFCEFSKNTFFTEHLRAIAPESCSKPNKKIG